MVTLINTHTIMVIIKEEGKRQAVALNVNAMMMPWCVFEGVGETFASCDLISAKRRRSE